MSTEDNVVRLRKTMYGRLEGAADSCGNCIDTDKMIKDSIPNMSIPVEYKHINIDTPEGKTFADSNKVDNIPATEVCEIRQSGKEECKTLIGPDPVKEKIQQYLKKTT